MMMIKSTKTELVYWTLRGYAITCNSLEFYFYARKTLRESLQHHHTSLELRDQEGWLCDKYFENDI